MISPHELERLWHATARALELVARSRCGAADDCVQEAFIRLASQTPVPDDPVAWLYQTVRHLAINRSRSARRLEHHERHAGQLREAWVEPIDPAIDDAEHAQRLTEALARLSDDERDIVIAHVWGNLTFRQLGTVMGVSPMTAHRHYLRAVESIRRNLIVTETGSAQREICHGRPTEP